MRRIDAVCADAQSCDIFCRVVDNFGDAGVCWRLARRLALGFGLRVRLWVDQPSTLDRLVLPGSADAALRATDRIEVLAWTPDTRFDAAADLAIETFGCDLPDAYATLAAARRPQTRWYNLEYLSAEDWVEGCHGLPSPHPRLPITRCFFFPGFTAATGGLLREPDLLARRAAFERRRVTAPRPLEIAGFCYADAPLPAMLDALEQTVARSGAGAPGVLCQVLQGPAQRLARDWSAARPRHRLQIDYLPWLDQDGFDQALWSADFALVRGEDSFVRAQWAGRPFLWDIYPQDDDAHLVKMAAFLRRYRAQAPAALGAAIGVLWQAWVRREAAQIGPAWDACLPELRAWRAHAEQWCRQLADRPEHADALMEHAGARPAPG